MKFFVSTILSLLLALSDTLSAQSAEEVTFEHEELTIFGTLNKPEGAGPYPTLILGPGSGPNDRDGTLLMVGGNVECLYPDLVGNTLRPYKQLAEALADSGYAVLRYDKPEFTNPGGLGTITFPKLWLPVESAIDYVKSRNDVDTNRIVLIGHSESSYLIPYISKSRSDILALISLAGARAPFDTLLTSQLVSFAEMCGGDVAEANVLAAQILAYYDFIRSGNFGGTTPPLFGIPAPVWSDYINVIDSVAINYDLAALPTLFVGLELDVNVPPSELIRFQNEINIPADFYSLPELNHYMTPMDNPNVSMALTDTLVHWLRNLPTVTSTFQLEGSEAALKAYPNPFRDRLTVEVNPQLAGAYDIVLRDAMGRKVSEAAIVSASGVGLEIQDLGRLPQGMYFLEMGKGVEREVIRLIKD